MTTSGSTGRSVDGAGHPHRGPVLAGVHPARAPVARPRRHDHGRHPPHRRGPEGPSRRGRGAAWGAPIDTVFETGPLAMMSVRTDVARQAEFVARHNPSYLLSLPSNLMALARHFAGTGHPAPEPPGGPQLRGGARPRGPGRVPGGVGRARGRHVQQPGAGLPRPAVPGLGALPRMSESGLGGGARRGGTAVPPGRGRDGWSSPRSTTTPCPSSATRSGDYAEVGEACRCGRGLPVLDRITGRQRNMLRPAHRRTLLADVRRRLEARRTSSTSSNWCSRSSTTSTSASSGPAPSPTRSR